MKVPHGKIIVSLACNDDGELVGLHLLRFDGANAAVRLPAEFGAVWETAVLKADTLRSSEPTYVERLLACARAATRTAEFEFGSPIARIAMRDGKNDPVELGNMRYFGMGHWGYDVGTIDAGPSRTEGA